MLLAIEEEDDEEEEEGSEEDDGDEGDIFFFLALLCKSILLLMILTIDAWLKIDQLYLPWSILARLTFLFVGFFLFIFIVFSQPVSLLLLLVHISIDEEDQEMIEMHVLAHPPAEQGTLHLICFVSFLFVTLPVFQLNPNHRKASEL